MNWKKYLCTLTVATLLAGTASACTLFAATGSEWVKGGGTLITKNRDWRPEWQDMRVVTNAKYQYYGMFAGSQNKRFLRGGVNEKGLAAFSASASTIPKKVRSQMPRAKKSILKVMLGECASVDEALSHTELFLGPRYILLGDAHKIAYVEIAPDGKYSVRVSELGDLAHTNHYLQPDLLWANRKIGISSQTRYNRITELLNNGKQPYGLDDFIAFSQDQHDGLDNSIWRRGSRPDRAQSLGTMSVLLQEGKSPQIYVKIRQAPDEKDKEKIIRLSGSDLFH